MMGSHKNLCANSCTFAKKGILLSKAGIQEDWLYRCMKIDRLISSDSVLHEVGCATYTTTASGGVTETPEDRTKKAVELINEANKWLKDKPAEERKGDQPK